MNITAMMPGGSTPATTATLPDISICPLCHHAIQALVHGQGAFTMSGGPKTQSTLQMVLACPRPECHRLFIARYERQTNAAVNVGWSLVDVRPGSHQAKAFAEEIRVLSPAFIEIYNQASVAEVAGLDLICGPGYRKALEFLTKDYLKSIAKTDTEKDAIEVEQLGTCIANRIHDPRMKKSASRAAWLGNDETHYIRKWVNKDLSDLKKMIDLTVHWISSEILTAELEASMPDPKKGRP